MATQSFTRSLLSKPKSLTFLISRSLSLSSATATATTSTPSLSRSLLRPLSAAVSSIGRPSARSFSTAATSSSISDPNPNWSNRPPKETILLDGCDFEHWLVVMEKPQDDATRDDIIDSYIKTLAQILGSEEEARMKIYSVSTRCYFAFGCIVSEELSYKIKELPGVRWVLPDSYLDVKNKNYGGEPFIDGEAVPYDPKYHEEWIRNNARAKDRNWRNERPRNSDKSRNYERRTPNRDFQNSPNQGMQNQGQNPPINNQDFRNPPTHKQPVHNSGFRNPPMNNQDFQSPPRPNQPMQNQSFQNPPMPNQPMNYQNFQNPPIPNQHMHNQHSQNPPMPNRPIQSRGIQNNPSVPPSNNNYYTGGQQNYYEAMPHGNAEWAPSSNAEGMPPHADWPGNAPSRDMDYPQNFQNRDYRSG